MVRFAYSDINKESEYELDQAAPSVERLTAAAAAAAAASSEDKEKSEMEKVGASGAQFNNEVALQQEVKNLEKEYKPGGAAGGAAPAPPAAPAGAANGAAGIAAAGVHGVPAVAEQKKPEKPIRPPQQLLQQGAGTGPVIPPANEPNAAARAAAVDPEHKFPKKV